MFCCVSTPSGKITEKTNTHEAEARHQRLANVLTPPPRAYTGQRPTNRESLEAPPPYSAALQSSGPYSSPAYMMYDGKDEKQAFATVTEVQNNEDRQPTEQLQSPRDMLAFSDTSSVLSIPSTQVTGLGSMYTGRHFRRDSDVASSRPPSYYPRSVDRRSSISSTNTTGRILGHPVMSEGWLDGLGADSRSMYGDGRTP